MNHKEWYPKISDIKDDSIITLSTFPAYWTDTYFYGKENYAICLDIDQQRWVYEIGKNGFYSDNIVTVLKPIDLNSIYLIKEGYVIPHKLDLNRSNPKETVLRFRNLMILK